MYQPCSSTLRFGRVFALAAGIAIPLLAQDLIFTANQPRTRVSGSEILPAGLPMCGTLDPSVPTSPVLYCYAPVYIWTAYNLLPLYQAGIRGEGQTIVIVDDYGSPTIASDLKAFDKAFGLPDPEFEIVCPLGCPTFNPR